uniref:Uncharacterized protein n=1 Tax=Pristionchus pacificus TaxID=54126 RepID=A0A8R1UWU5_PRIPA
MNSRARQRKNLYPFVVLICAIVYLIVKYSSKAILIETYNIIPSARSNTSLEINIVIVLTKGSDTNEYATALNTLECYSALHGYRLIIEHDDRFPECSIHMDKFFRRHCHTHKMMTEELPEDSWIFFIDADNGIANPQRLIDDLIEPDYDIYLYNRFFNWEMAAQYLIKNNERGRDWLRQWSEYEFKTPASTHGSDNGALHVLMMNYLAPEKLHSSGLAKECLSIWDRSGHIGHLFNMESCVRMVIGERTYFPAQRVKIFPKTISFARDLWQLYSHWSTDDFILHAVKERYFKPSSLDYLARRFENLRSALEDPSNDVLLPSPLNDISSCDSVFPLLNKLNIDKCRNGTETWIMDTRFKISEKLHRQMLEEMSDRILKEQVRNIYICAELI